MPVFSKIMGRVDALAMPFLSDAGGAEDDYVLPPRARLV